MFETACNLATHISNYANRTQGLSRTLTSDFLKSEPNKHTAEEIAIAAAHEAVCELLGVLVRLDSLMARPKLPLLFRLLAAATPHQMVCTKNFPSTMINCGTAVRGGLHFNALHHSILTTFAAERQLTLIVRLLVLQVQLVIALSTPLFIRIKPRP